jgi:hypothetical protein
MDHKLATIVGAAAVLVAVPATKQATAVPAEPAIPAASSHADLLQPIPNAVERLRIADSESAARRPMLEKIQYGGPVDHHHHHHHHHHHSHDWYMQNGYRWFGGRWVTGDYYAHHHHHHHHHHHEDDR